MMPNRLDLRRVAGLADASLLVALLSHGYASAYAASAPMEQATEIIHQSLRCWPAEEYVVVSVDVRPAGDVHKNLVYFRWDRHAGWYFVPMILNAQGAWVAILPKTQPETTGIVYVFESISSSYMATRSDEFRVSVRPASQCDNAGAVIFTGTSPNISLGATSGTPLAPGFQASGISSFISPTGMTSAATGGGGVSGTLALIGGAGGAAFVLALSGGDVEATTTSDGIGGVTTTAGTTTTTTVSGGGPSSTTTITGGGGTTSVGGGGSTTSIGGGSTTTTGGSSTTTSAGSSTTTSTGGSTTSSSSTTTSTASTSSSSSSSTTTASSASLIVSKTGPSPVVVGNNLTYTIQVTNTGGGTAIGVDVDDTIPASMTVLSASVGCGFFPGNRIICGLLNIAGGQTKTVTITVQATSVGMFTNTALVSSANAGNPSDSTSTQVNTSLRVADAGAITLSVRAFLDIQPYDGNAQGHIVVNESISRQVANDGFRVLRLDTQSEDNVLEARAITAGAEGFWRFDFSASPEFEPGSIRIRSGQVVSVGAATAVLRAGNGAPSVSFSFSVKLDRPGSRDDE